MDTPEGFTSHMSPTMIVQYNSFEQCNDALMHIDNLNDIDITSYMELVANIPYDDDLIEYTNHGGSEWISNAVKYFIEVAGHDARAFKIDVSQLEHLGFNIDNFSSKSPKWFQSLTGKTDRQLYKEVRFVKRHKLIENIDYFVKDTEDMGGCFITRPAMYRLVANKFGMKFLESIIGRMGQIIYFFNEFKSRHRETRLESLQTLIEKLNQEIQDLKKNTLEEYSYHSLEENCISQHSFSSSHSYIASDVIMDSKEYIDELSGIHKTMEQFINRVDGRMTNVDHKLSTITNKIDDLVGSISLSKDEHFSESFDQKNPLIDHVNDIFKEYEQIGAKTRSLPNYDYTTIISQLRSKRNEPDYYSCLGREEQL